MIADHEREPRENRERERERTERVREREPERDDRKDGDDIDCFLKDGRELA